MYKSTLGILALGILGAVAFGCSSDDSGGGGTKADYTAQCKRICSKYDACEIEFDCGRCDVIPESATNCNFSKVKAKVDECTKADCGDVTDCVAEIFDICPQLDDVDEGTGGGSGSGGSPGSGGKSSGGSTSSGGGGNSPGSGGSGGGTSGGDCSVCEKAEECCRGVAEYAGEDAADCDGLAAACEGAGDSQDIIVTQCESILQTASALPVPACK